MRGGPVGGDQALPSQCTRSPAKPMAQTSLGPLPHTPSSCEAPMDGNCFQELPS